MNLIKELVLKVHTGFGETAGGVQSSGQGTGRLVEVREQRRGPRRGRGKQPWPSGVARLRWPCGGGAG